MKDMEQVLKVAIVQTTLDNKVAWRAEKKPNLPIRMDYAEAVRVWHEVLSAVGGYVNLEDSHRPDIILLPELSVAASFQSALKKIAGQTGCIIIAGLDFVTQGLEVENQALVVIPYRWPHGNGVTRAKTFRFGKHFAASEESQFLKDCGKKFRSCDQIYVLDAGRHGRIGLAICADFYDIERFVLYKGRIQHLFILAYNRDVKSFHHLCEAIARLVYCNVVICNTGHYGGSICFSPKDQEWKRYIYRHEGADLFTAQVVSLPVAALLAAQQCISTGKPKEFKSPPPGYKWQYGDNKILRMNKR